MSDASRILGKRGVRARSAVGRDVAVQAALGPRKSAPGIPEPTTSGDALFNTTVALKIAVETLLRQRGQVPDDSAVLASDLDAIVDYLDQRYRSPAHNPNGTMRWRGFWVTGREYKKHDVVRDGDWTMIALRDTYDRPAPQAIGQAAYIYQGSSPTGPITAKELTVGHRYIWAVSGWLSGWRAFTVAGNYYRIFSIVDPDGANEFAEILSFDATTTGWHEASLTPQFILAGTVFELWSAAQEPDPTPTIWTGNWDYGTPPNPGTPVSGSVVHANSLLSVLSIHKVDNDGGDRGAELLALDIGDIFVGPGDLRWSVQGVADQGLYVDIAIAPAQQAVPDGVFNFSFETVTATPITTVIDPDYYLGNAGIDGRYRVDGGAVVVTQSAYGIDVEVQQAYISSDWALVAYSG